MTPPATVSVIVASRGRPDHLRRCLTGIAQQDHPAFEVIVVGDGDAMAVASGRPVKRVTQDEPNLSESRNLGLRQAAGSLVAFIDDDAVPAPGWLRAICAPFADPSVDAAGGRVLGAGWHRTDWMGGTADAEGVVTPAGCPADRTTLQAPGPRGVPTVLGCNMAFRRDLLAAAGGFDPALRYYLDETDLCLRLAGRLFAFVPAATVFHFQAPSSVRGPGGALHDATEIGASQMVFLRKHVAQPERAAALERFQRRMRGRLIRQMVNGLSEPGGIVPVMETLSAGIRAGRKRKIGPLPPVGQARSPLLAHPPATGEVSVLAGRIWNRRTLMQSAAERVSEGGSVVVLILGPTALFHRVSYVDPGIWLQSGGLFGRALRDDPLIRFTSFDKRAAEEAGRWRGDARET